MASVFAHSAIALIVRTRPERRLTIALLVLSLWPDLDYLTLAFEVRPNEMLGHRGLTHSIAAAIAASAIAWLFVRRDFLLLLGVAASHGVLDAITGSEGAALLAPFSNVRLRLPIVPSCPMGLDEWLGGLGFLTLANEILYVLFPIAIVVTVRERKRLGILGGIWIALALLLRTAWPASFAPTVPRMMQPIGSLDAIPIDRAKLVTRVPEFRALGLLDVVLEPKSPAWSSSFFPSWFGAEAGRWQDGAPALVWRTLVGTRAATESEARAIGFGLSPTEKVDLAFAQKDFPATNDALAFTHNARPRPRYWFGRCSGVSGAAVNFPEPYRVVDVTAVDGSHVRFHPQDIKSLLAIAYSKPEHFTIVGDECSTVAFDAPAACSMSPALLVVALLNQIGIAKQSLVIDAVPTPANQYYAVASAKVHVGDDRRFTIDLVLSSTTLSYARANVVESTDVYRKVGVVPVPMSYSGTLELGPNGEIRAGKWDGDGPDNAVFLSASPALGANCTLLGASFISWPFVRELARASAENGDGAAALDLRTACGGQCKCDTP